MEDSFNKLSKYVPHLLLAAFFATLTYLGLTKDSSESYIKFNLDDSSYVHADDPTPVDSGCGSSGDGDGGDA